MSADMLYPDLASLQSALFRFYENHRDHFPSDEFTAAYGRADDAIQDMLSELEGNR